MVFAFIILATFGGILLLLFIFLPITLILFILYLIKGNNRYLRRILQFWAVTLALSICILILGQIFSLIELSKKDYYGTYIIDKKYYPGRQADWQYENFRFEIKHNDSIYFYVTDKNKINTTYYGSIKTTPNYYSERLILKMAQPTHHILKSNPTTSRGIWDFYLVFKSDSFNNVFFKKGTWTE